MKSYRRWDAVIDPLNLWRAWREYERGKRRRPEVAAFALDADRHVHRLARELAAERYRPGRYDLLRITDPQPGLFMSFRLQRRICRLLRDFAPSGVLTDLPGRLRGPRSRSHELATHLRRFAAKLMNNPG